MRITLPSWIVPVLLAAIAGFASYYAGQVSIEHRLTTMEDAAAAHAREDDRGTTQQAKIDHDLWHAICVNAGRSGCQ